MANDIHTTSTGEAAVPWRERAFFKNCEALRPYVQWAIIVGVLLFGVYTAQRDTNAQQSVSVVDIRRDLDDVKLQVANNALAREKQMDRLVTTERFEERTVNISQRLDRIEARQEEILLRLGPRP